MIKKTDNFEKQKWYPTNLTILIKYAYSNALKIRNLTYFFYKNNSIFELN